MSAIFSQQVLHSESRRGGRRGRGGGAGDTGRGGLKNVFRVPVTCEHPIVFPFEGLGCVMRYGIVTYRTCSKASRGRSCPCPRERAEGDIHATPCRAVLMRLSAPHEQVPTVYGTCSVTSQKKVTEKRAPKTSSTAQGALACSHAFRRIMYVANGLQQLSVWD